MLIFIANFKPLSRRELYFPDDFPGTPVPEYVLRGQRDPCHSKFRK